MTNSFSSFEYNKAADYLPAYDRRVNEERQAEALVKEQMAENDAQRKANAKLYGNAINSVLDLSPKLAKLWKDERDKNDKKMRNRSIRLYHQLQGTGLNFNIEERTKWRDDNEENKKHDSWIHSVAADLENTAFDPGVDSESRLSLAEQVRGMSGRSLVIFNETFLQQEAGKIGNKWKQARSGDNPFTAKIADETAPDGFREVTFGNAKSLEEKTWLRNQWLDEIGLNEVSGFTNELLEEKYWKEVDRQTEVLDRENQLTFAKQLKTEREEGVLTELKAAAGYSPTALAEKMIEIVNRNHAYEEYGGTTSSARKVVNGYLVQLASDEDITAQQYKAALNVHIPHKGAGGKMMAIKDIWKKDFGFDIEDQLDAISNKQAENRQSSRDAIRTRKGDELLQWVEENGGNISEAQLQEYKARWVNDPETRGLPLPESYNALATRSVEDRGNEELVNLMQHRLDNGVPIGTIWRDIKGDPQLMSTWSTIAESPAGQGNLNIKQAEKTIGIYVAGKLELDYGVSGPNTPQYLRTYNRAVNAYKEHFRLADGKFETEQERHNFALERTDQQIQRGLFQQGSTDSTSSPEAHSVLLNDVATTVIKDRTAINNGILPGTQTYYNQGLKFVNNPRANSVPRFYYSLAKKLNLRDQYGRRIDGWDILNAQHLSQTGQEIPKIDSRERILENSNKHKSILELWNNPSQPAKTRAQVYVEEKGDFTPYTLEGVIKVIK